VPHPLIVLIIM